MRMDDARMDQIIGGLLRAGVMAAVFVVLAGGIWYLAQHGTTVPEYRAFREQPGELRTVGGVIGGVLRGDPLCLIQLGLLILMATPVARVAFSVFAFATQHDRLYVWITLLVFVLLVASLSGLLDPAK